MRVNWAISNKCNYSCPYCYNQGSSEKTDFKLNNDLIDIVLNKINLLDDSFSFTLTGGEPTICDFLPYIARRIHEFDNLEYFSIITNGSREISYFKQFLAYRDKLFFRFSIHPKYWNEKKQELLKYLTNNFKVLVSILHDHSSLVVNAAEFIDEIKTSNLEPSIRKVFQYEYSEEEKKFIDDTNKKWNVPENIADKQRFTGKFCTFGKDLLVLHSNLSFSAAFCNKAPKKSMPIFLLTEEIFKKFKKIKQCDFSCCQFPTDAIILKKFDDLKSAEEYLNKKFYNSLYRKMCNISLS